MKIANISTTKNHLSALLEEVRRGETVVIVDHKRPVARLDRVESGAGGADISLLIHDGILSPPSRKADVRAFLKLPRGIAPQAALAQAVAEDRDGR